MPGGDEAIRRVRGPGKTSRSGRTPMDKASTRTIRRALLLAGTLAVACCAGAWAEEPAREATSSAETPNAQAVEEGAAEAERPYERQSFWFIGTSNYHLRLEESERKIDRMIDDPFGLVVPGWDRPTTFKDWSDDFRIWDLWAGYGRDINPKWSWSVYGGGGAGTIHNRRRLLPLRLDIDFTRRSVMAGSSVTYYPFGKPRYRGRSYRETFLASRPMLEMNVGATHQTVIGDVRASLPLLGRILRIEDKEKFTLYWTSPRAGVEIPLGERTSLNVLGGYLFFHDHAAEFNGAMLEVFIRRRF